MTVRCSMETRENRAEGCPGPPQAGPSPRGPQSGWEAKLVHFRPWLLVAECWASRYRQARCGPLLCRQTYSVALGQAQKLSEPQIPHLEHGCLRMRRLCVEG